MSKKIALSLVITLMAATSAQAGGFNNSRSSSLLGALVTVGNHGSIANVAASVGPSNGGYRASSSIADVNASLLGGAVRAGIDVGQSNRRGNTLLGIDANVLGGGVGHSRW